MLIKNTYEFRYIKNCVVSVATTTLLILGCLNTVNAEEAPVFMGGFETGDDFQWDGVQYNENFDKSRQFSIVTSPVRQGNFAAKLVVNDGDEFRETGGERVDLIRSPIYDEKEGDEYWYAWSTFFPTDWQAPKDWFVFADWHSRYDDVCQLLQLEVTTDNALLAKVLTGDVFEYECFEGKGTAISESKTIVDKLDKNIWNDFIIHVKWTAQSTGVIEIFHKTENQENFTEVLSLKDIPTLQYQLDSSLPASPYFKLAHYRSNMNTHKSTLYHDGFRQGKTVESIASGELYRLKPSEKRLKKPKKDKKDKNRKYLN